MMINLVVIPDGVDLVCVVSSTPGNLLRDVPGFCVRSPFNDPAIYL